MTKTTQTTIDDRSTDVRVCVAFFIPTTQLSVICVHFSNFHSEDYFNDNDDDDGNDNDADVPNTDDANDVRNTHKILSLFV